MTIALAKIYLTVMAPYLALVGLVLVVAALLYIWALHRRLTKLLSGRGGSLEEVIAVLGREMQEIKTFRSELEKYLKLVETRLRGGVSGVGVVRFNPFAGEGQGGNQSFAAALLDEEGHGVVLSTLYTRDRVGVYAKPLEQSVSTYELTTEEKQAIEKAQDAIAVRKPKK